jgi:hypothetical protein
MIEKLRNEIMIEKDKLFEEMWKLSIQKFESQYGPLTGEDGADYGKPFMYAAWKEVVAPKLDICEDPDYGCDCGNVKCKC